MCFACGSHPAGPKPWLLADRPETCIEALFDIASTMEEATGHAGTWPFDNARYATRENPEPAVGGLDTGPTVRTHGAQRHQAARRTAGPIELASEKDRGSLATVRQPISGIRWTIS